MNLQELLPQLKYFDQIIVTGPQRSGTTLATKVIATELKYEYVFESAFEVDDLSKFANVLQKKRIVVQAPGLSSVVHLFAKAKNVAAVFMMRDVAEIIESQKRIEWTEEYQDIERNKYFLPKIGGSQTAIPTCALKVNDWNSYQKDFLRERGFELEYNSLSEHPLWIPKEQRTGIQPEGMGTKTILEQTVERLKDKLSLPIVKMSLGAGLHYKLEQGVDCQSKDEEDVMRREQKPSKVWINHDGCNHGGIDLCCEWDAIPLPDACIDFLELGDVVEHVMKFEQDRIYAEWFRLVKPSGKVHISTPNLHRAMIEYTAQVIAGPIKGETVVSIRNKNDGLTREAIINPPSLQSNPLQMAIQQIYAWMSNRFEYHYYTYTVQTLREMLEKHGFGNIDFSESPGDDHNPGREMAWWLVCTATKK